MPGVVILILIGGLLYWSWLALFTAFVLMHPPRKTYAWAVSRGRAGDPSELTTPLEYETWTLSHGRAGAVVWDIKGRRADGVTVILTPGWADSAIVALPRVEAIASHVARIVVWNPPHHGESPGRCSLGLREAGMLGALLERVGGAERVVFWGWSLGAGVSLAVAAGARVAGVIAESPYRMPMTPARSVLANRGLPHALNLPPAIGLVSLIARRSFAGFDRREVAARVSCPVLVIHGDQDAICPIDDAREIAAAAPHGELVVVPGGTHHNLWYAPEQREVCAAAAIGFVGAIASDPADKGPNPSKPD